MKDNFDDIVQVKDARLKDQCTMECEFCDCTRAMKLPGKPLLDELHIKTREEDNDKERIDNFIDIGRIKLNRKKQKEGLDGLRSIIHAYDDNNNLKINQYLLELQFLDCLQFFITKMMMIISE